jgi:hypothetical protein
MTERVDIANIALSLLGEQDITSLEDDLNRARQMRINYIPARDATLEAHDWSFAIERFIPPVNAIPPVYGATFAFDIPPNILRVIAVDNPKTTSNTDFTLPINSREQLDWQFENRQIITNSEVIWVRGIRRVEQEGKFSPLFVEAFAARLAYMCALNLTASAEIQANMKGIFDEYIHEAKSRDGLQGRSRRLRNRSLIKSR